MRARRRDRAAQIAFALAAVAYLGGLGLRPLLAPDELRYAEAAREMLAGGDWVVPHLDGVPYFEKPVLGYWVTALSLWLFGENAFAVRLPFALATLATGVVAWALLRRFGPGGGFAPAAAIGLLSSVGVAALGTTAVFDPLLAFALTACLGAFFVATQRAPGWSRQAWLLASGLACGLAFLAKGFLGVAIPAGVAGAFLLASGRLRESLRLGVTPMLSAVATAAPWSLAIALREPGFWHHFVVHEHLRRFSGGQMAQHEEPFWFYLPVLLVGALPWTPLLAWIPRREALSSPLGRFAAAWLVVPLLLLSASSGKLPTYALPCFPPLFVLLALAAAGRTEAARSAAMRRLCAGFAGVFCVAGLLLLSPLPRAVGLEAALGDGAAALWTPWALALLLMAALAALGSRSRGALHAAGALAAAIGVALLASMAFFPGGLPRKTPEAWIRRHVLPVPADAIVVSHRHFVYALCWQLRRDDVRVLGPPGELEDGLARPGQEGRLLDDAALTALLQDPRRRLPVVVMALRDRIRLPRHPAPSRNVTSDTVAFAEYPAPTDPGVAAGP